jgi:LmbE family N-acetylglucosaminyl deacetylase
MKKLRIVLVVVFLFLAVSAPVLGATLLDGATVITCHPDDESLWWSPVLNSSREIVMACFPSSAVMAHYITDEMPEWYQKKWIPLQGFLLNCDAKQLAHNKPLRESVVTDEFLTLRLEEFVRDAKVIVTHSPWGEYGHIQHRQIWRVVEALAIKYGKDVWVWNGIVSAHSLAVYGEAWVGSVPTLTVSTDFALYSQLRQTYVDAESLCAQNPLPNSYWWDCRFWTWDRTWEGMPSYLPPSSVVFIKMIGGGKILYDSYFVEDIVKKVLLEYQGYY